MGQGRVLRGARSGTAQWFQAGIMGVGAIESKARMDQNKYMAHRGNQLRRRMPILGYMVSGSE